MDHARNDWKVCKRESTRGKRKSLQVVFGSIGYRHAKEEQAALSRYAKFWDNEAMPLQEFIGKEISFVGPRYTGTRFYN